MMGTEKKGKNLRPVWFYVIAAFVSGAGLVFSLMFQFEQMKIELETQERSEASIRLEEERDAFKEELEQMKEQMQSNLDKMNAKLEQ